jgi:SagB-type dehydrogenase family enzyme
MENSSDEIRLYEELVHSKRVGAPNPLIPPDYRVNWLDAPSRFSMYLDSARVALSGGLNRRELRLGEPPESSVASNCRTVSLDEISDFLFLSAGVLRRKLVVNWGVEGSRVVANRGTTYSRGSASGGGLYPVAAYLVLREQLGLPGVYHYDAAHHGLTRLRLGNSALAVAAALDYQDADSSDFWIVLTVHFWRNAFKYHNFGYQVVSQDVGANIGSMEQVANSLGWNTTVIYWFRDRLLCSLLSLDVANDAPFAVIAVRKNVCGVRRPDALPPAQESRSSSQDIPPIRQQLYERSHKAFLPEMLSRVHERTLLDDVHRPPLKPLVWKLGVSSRPQKSIVAELGAVLANRETSWGRFRREPPLDEEVLRQILGFVADGVHYNTDVYGCRVALPTLRISVIAQSVSNLPRGVYDYDFSDSGLSPRKSLTLSASLQSLYLLTNHNVDQVSAVLLLVGRLDCVLKTFGARGIRVMNAETGIAAQRAYMAAAAFSLGCGAALGFDSHQVTELLDLDETLEVPLLLVFVGNQSKSAFAYDFSLY